MEKRNFNGILKTENGKGVRVDLPTTDEKFKELLGSLTGGDLTQPWGISGLCVYHEAEAQCLAGASSLSEINYFCAVVKNFTDEEYVLYQALLDAGFCYKRVLHQLIDLALNLHTFEFYTDVPDTLTLGKKILESYEEDELYPETFRNASDEKLTWLGEIVQFKYCGRFIDGVYIQYGEDYQLLYDGPADIPECFRISVPLWDNEPK